MIMKKEFVGVCCALLGLLLPLSSEALEKNLINNSNFSAGMRCWSHSGPGEAKLLKKGIALSGGRLSHYIDLGNLEHAQPACGAPYGRKFRFRIAVKGKGTLKLGIRARVMTSGNALEFSELWSESLTIPEKAGTLDFEAMGHSLDAVFHDKLMIELADDSNAEITSTVFFYLDRKGPALSFSPEASVVRPGDTVKVTLKTSEPNRKLACSLFPGEFSIGGYLPAKHWDAVSDANGTAEFTFTVPMDAQDGVRLSVLDTQSGVKADFFATILPEKLLQEYRKTAQNITGAQHILFLGDSLSDYDRGRNYISVTHCFLPKGYTVRNAGVGGDTLSRIWLRLQGKPTVRNNMYDNLFSPKPDLIFILCGANDAKASSRSGYKETFTPEAEQASLWESIIVHLKKNTKAKIVLITAPVSYLPYQYALAAPLKQAGLSHSVFGLPELHDRYNARLREIAKKHGLEVIDFDAAIRNHPDPQLLRVPDDGVHLSLKGHQLLAGLVLQNLASGETMTDLPGGAKTLQKNFVFKGNERVKLQGSSQLHCTDAGLTLSIDVKPLNGKGDVEKREPEALDIYLFKDNEFFVGRYGDRLYANFHDGNRFCAHTMSKPGVFPPVGKWSRVTVVIAPLKGDKCGGSAVLLYLNGKFVRKKEFPGKKPVAYNSFAELGYGWGNAWSYQGELGNVRIFPYAMPPEKIAEDFAGNPCGK